MNCPSFQVTNRYSLATQMMIWVGALSFSLALPGRLESSEEAIDARTVRDLLARVEQLEARVHDLEAEKAALSAKLAPEAASQAPSSLDLPAAPTVQDPVPPRPVVQEAHESMPMESETPRLQIRGFADVRFGATDLEGATDSFGLGQFNLFITSKIFDRLSVLAEMVTEADPSTNTFGTELERLLLNYRYSDRLNVAFGRYHTAIGFYNTAYHHSAWLQTTVDRPFLFEFEDDGGILPIHNVGLTVTGAIPSGSVGLRYVAEVGNGRAARTDLDQDPVQNVTDENNWKAFNLALLARPDSVPGLEVGASGYHDTITPLEGPKVDELILSAHAVYQRPMFEFLNEVVVVRHHAGSGTPTLTTPGFYTQISRQIDRYRPYFRYEYLDVDDRELILPDVDNGNGPLFGLRYDWREFAALKAQYGRTNLRHAPSFNSFTLQAAFTF